MSNGIHADSSINPLMQTIHDHFRSILQNQQSKEDDRDTKSNETGLNQFVQGRILQQNLEHIENIQTALKKLSDSPSGIVNLIKEIEILESTLSAIPQSVAIQKMSLIEATVNAMHIFQKEVFNNMETTGNILQRLQEIRTRYHIESKPFDFLHASVGMLSTLIEKNPKESLERLINWKHYCELEEKTIMKALSKKPDGSALVWYDRNENNLVLLLVEKKGESVHVDSIDLNDSMFDPLSQTGMSAAFFELLKDENGTLTTVSDTIPGEILKTPNSRRVRFAEYATRRSIDKNNRFEQVTEKTKTDALLGKTPDIPTLPPRNESQNDDDE